MKKISFTKLASALLLLVLAFDANPPALADRIDMTKLQPAERVEAIKLKQQG